MLSETEVLELIRKYERQKRILLRHFSLWNIPLISYYNIKIATLNEVLGMSEQKVIKVKQSFLQRVKQRLCRLCYEWRIIE
jgi:hypothetical protein